MPRKPEENEAQTLLNRKSLSERSLARPADG
jgi:hypothetical protein